MYLPVHAPLGNMDRKLHEPYEIMHADTSKLAWCITIRGSPSHQANVTLSEHWLDLPGTCTSSSSSAAQNTSSLLGGSCSARFSQQPWHWQAAPQGSWAELQCVSCSHTARGPRPHLSRFAGRRMETCAPTTTPRLRHARSITP